MRKSLVVILMILCGMTALSQDSVNHEAVDTARVQPQVVYRAPVQKPRVIRRDTARADSSAVMDSAVRKDSIPVVLETVYRPTISLFKLKIDTPFFAHHPYYQFTNPIRYTITIKKWRGKEAVFYSMMALLIFFALIKNGFGRYLQDLFKTFFQTNVKQKQTREQLLQNPLPSVFLNLFFTLSIGMFLALLLQYFKLAMDFNFWWLYLYCVLGLISMYTLKFVSLKLLGWIFQVSESIEAYIFIVFSTNKIMGILLLPLLVLLSFTHGVVNQAAMSLSIMVVFALIAYRFFLSFVTIRRKLRISFFHFLLYLFAFEVIPLLLINKLLFRFLAETS